jgi:type III secretion protein Q
MNSSMAQTGSPHPAAALRASLKHYTTEEAALLQVLFAKPRRWHREGSNAPFWFELRKVRDDIDAQSVSVTIGGRSARIALAPDIADNVGELTWSDYSGSARLTAWTLAHRRALTRLTRIFGSVVLPQALLERDCEAATCGLAVGFIMNDDLGQRDEGVLHVSPSLLRELLESTQESPRPEVPSLALNNLPGTLRVCARGPELTLHELRSLEFGDVLMIGDRQSAFSQLYLVIDEASPFGWHAIWSESRVQIEGTASCLLADAWRTPMNETPDTASDNTEDSPAPALDPLSHLPVRLAFTIGEKSLTIEELASFAPGYVFDLATPVEHTRVGIRANGKHIGYGRLVSVGDALGVQLEGWDADGLQ